MSSPKYRIPVLLFITADSWHDAYTKALDEMGKLDPHHVEWASEDDGWCRDNDADETCEPITADQVDEICTAVLNQRTDKK